MEANAFGVPVRREADIAKAGELYIADKLQQGLKGNTISKNKRTIDRLVEFLGQDSRGPQERTAAGEVVLPLVPRQ
jgi:hypothetical protein